MRKFSNRGFTLLETMIALSIGSIIIYSLMHINGQIARVEARMLDNLDMQDLVSRIRFTMADQLACNKTIFEAVSKEDEESWLPKKSDLLAIVDRRGKVLVAKGDNYNRFIIENIKYEIELEDVEEEDKFVEGAYFVKLQIQAKANRPKANSKVHPVTFVANFLKLENEDEDNLKLLFDGCDSMTSPFVNQIVNQTTEKICKSLGIGYDKLSGQCKAGLSLPKGGSVDPSQLIEMQKKLMEMIKN